MKPFKHVTLLFQGRWFQFAGFEPDKIRAAELKMFASALARTCKREGFKMPSATIVDEYGVI